LHPLKTNLTAPLQPTHLVELRIHSLRYKIRPLPCKNEIIQVHAVHTELNSPQLRILTSSKTHDGCPHSGASRPAPGRIWVFTSATDLTTHTPTLL
ncbi:hypothetical protein L9F63_006494, partial [Diploptera punctata]